MVADIFACAEPATRLESWLDTQTLPGLKHRNGPASSNTSYWLRNVYRFRANSTDSVSSGCARSDFETWAFTNCRGLLRRGGSESQLDLYKHCSILPSPSSDSGYCSSSSHSRQLEDLMPVNKYGRKFHHVSSCSSPSSTESHRRNSGSTSIANVDEWNNIHPIQDGCDANPTAVDDDSDQDDLDFLTMPTRKRILKSHPSEIPFAQRDATRKIDHTGQELYASHDAGKRLAPGISNVFVERQTWFNQPPKRGSGSHSGCKRAFLSLKCDNWIMFNAKYTRAHGDPNNKTSTQEQPVTASITNAQGNIDHKTSSRGLFNSGDSRKLNNEGSDDDQPQPEERKKRRYVNQVTTKRRLACPFYKNNPVRFSSCKSFKLDGISRVTQHITRDAAYRPPCASRPTQEESSQFNACIEGHLNCHQRKELKDIVKKTATSEDNWYAIYEYIFPHAIRPRDPYYECPFEEFVRGFRDFAALEMKDVVNNYIGDDFQNLTYNGSNALARSLFELSLRDCVDHLCDRYIAAQIMSPEQYFTTTFLCPSTSQSMDPGGSSQVSLASLHSDLSRKSSSAVSMGSPLSLRSSNSLYQSRISSPTGSEPQKMSNWFSYAFPQNQSHDAQPSDIDPVRNAGGWTVE